MVYKSILLCILFVFPPALNANAGHLRVPNTDSVAMTSSAVKVGVVTMEEGRHSFTPFGFKKFCTDEQRYCSMYRQSRKSNPPRMVLTNEREAELFEVNRSVNRRIAPMPETSFFTGSLRDNWKIPTTSGDCEDYVLLKQAELIERGWSKNALLVTIADNAKGYRHAVLTVRTDAGDFILDNENNEVKDWREVNFRWIKRQSARNMMRWVEIKPVSDIEA